MNKISIERLQLVHPDLRRVIFRAEKESSLAFIVTEGLRSKELQKELYDKGASQTLDSRHITGHAVDLAVVIGKEVRWDWPLYYTLAEAVKKAAAAEGIPIEWGGDWKKFKDGPHFQLPKKLYP